MKTMNTLRNILTSNSLFLLILFSLTVVSCNDSNEDDSIRVNRLKIDSVDENGVILMTEGDSHSVTVTLSPEEAIDKDTYNYRYTSANEAVFTVSESGLITATGVGEAVLSVWSVNNTDLWTTGIVKVEKRIYPVTSISIPEQYQNYYMSVDNTFKLGNLIKVFPDNASSPDVIYRSSDNMIAEVNEYGEVYTKALGDVTITIEATDGSGVTANSQIHIRDVDYSQLLPREEWSVATSHDYFVDASVSGAPESLTDGNLNSCLVMVKPGKSAGGITVGADESVFFVIDMQSAQNFDFFKLRHRTSNTSANLRVTKVAVYGSNDGENFSELLKDAPVSSAAAINEVTIVLPEKVNYRYFKLQYTGWSNSGNTIQISEFNIGSAKFLDL